MTILCYHTVEPDWPAALAVTPAAFDLHMEWLASHRRVLHLDHAVSLLDAQGRLPRGAAALTFDDGFSGLYDYARPVLLRHRLPATLFLVAQTLAPEGRAVDWVNILPEGRLPQTLTLAQVLELQEAGFRFGSHSHSHRTLTELSDAECERDLRQSRELLADLLHAPVPFLAYPRGRHDQRVRRAAARAGYSHSLALPEGREQVGPHSIPRVGVYRGNSVWTLKTKLARWYLPVRTSGVFPMLQRLGRGGSHTRYPA
jgi:peptidoglycan/xylan/chitin deacetylase (PgdA/CDA1 family)